MPESECHLVVMPLAPESYPAVPVIPILFPATHRKARRLHILTTSSLTTSLTTSSLTTSALTTGLGPGSTTLPPPSLPPAAIGNACPGLFYPTPAVDGYLTRIRTPGGILNSEQARYLATLAEQHGTSSIGLTNRANVQLRLTTPTLSASVLQTLQRLKLAAACPAIDHLRNLMLSPTAGIDPAAIVDSRALATAIDDYLNQHPELAPLSAKFSIGIDGGESIPIRQRANDVLLVAELTPMGQPHWRLFLGLESIGAVDTGIGVGVDQAMPLVAAILQIYQTVAPTIAPVENQQRRSQKVRLRDVAHHIGLVAFCDQLRDRLRTVAGAIAAEPIESCVPPAPTKRYPIGIHPQIQAGQYYVGLAIPLGQMSPSQLRSLAKLADRYGTSELRLTPCQNILLPNISAANLSRLKLELAPLHFDPATPHPEAAIVACAGQPGCASALGDVQTDAIALIEQRRQQLVEQSVAPGDRRRQSNPTNTPLNIHFSGCSKGCAQPYQSDIALMAVADETGQTRYDLYLPGAPGQAFGRLFCRGLTPAKLLATIDQLTCLNLLRPGI
jgi:ferredoxin-nitrite reductase